MLRQLQVAGLLLTLCALALSGCGGHSARQERQRAGHAAAPAGSSSSGPVLSTGHVRASLLPAREVAPDVQPRALTFPGLTRAAVPGCSASAISLPGQPETIGRQLEASPRGYGGTHYIQLIAVYPDTPAASRAIAKVRAAAAACPARRHFPARRLGRRRFAVEHTDTWTVTEDTVAGWSHVRGFEKHVDPPSTSRLNVFCDVYDYAARGNILVATLYWERVKPTTPLQPIAGNATAVLTRQLQKIG